MTKYLPDGLSPLPWEQQTDGASIDDAESCTVADCFYGDPLARSELNARFLAHAANTHEALCQALDEYRLMFHGSITAAGWLPTGLERDLYEHTRALLAKCAEAAKGDQS